MINQLKASIGKKIAIELVSGNEIFGTLLEVNEKNLQMDTNDGIVDCLVESVKIIWNTPKISLSEADMEEISEKVKDNADKRYVCLGANGFRCPQSYTCRPPHACNNFSCTGSFSGTFVPPPDEPCVGQFFGFKRSTSGNGDKETKE